MTRNRAATILGLCILGAVLVGATAAAYRGVIEHWEGDPRGTLIAAAIVGISFFLSMLSILSWTERRQKKAESLKVAPGLGSPDAKDATHID